MPIQKWNCQRCNRGYPNFEAAEICEQQHAIPNAILGTDHKSHFQTDDGNRYPKTIIVAHYGGKPDGVYQFKAQYRPKRPDAGRGVSGRDDVLSAEPEQAGDTAPSGHVGI
jgi:hypothetical protein